MINVKRLNENTHDLSITGCLLPWLPDLNRPFLVASGAPGDDTWLLPVFRDEPSLRAAMQVWRSPLQDGAAGYAIKSIDDSVDFLRSVRESAQVNDVRVMVALDPWFTPQGTVRFLGVFLSDEPLPLVDPGPDGQETNDG